MSADAVSEDQYRAAHLNLLAGIEAQLTRIADNTGHADEPVTEQRILDAWESRGQRIHGDLVVETIRSLGIEVD